MIIAVGMPLLKSYEEFMMKKEYINERTAKSMRRDKIEEVDRQKSDQRGLECCTKDIPL